MQVMTYISRGSLTAVICLLTLGLKAWEVFFTNTENHRRCRKMCMYQIACSRVYFRNKRCVLICDPESHHGDVVNTPEIFGNGACEDDDICVPTGVSAPIYRREIVLGVNLMGLKGYRIYAKGRKFDGAVQYCEDQGGQLFVVENHTQWQTIADLAIAHDLLNQTNLAGFWVNGNDRSLNGSFVTTSGEPMPFMKWGPNEPDYYSGAKNTVTDCVELREDNDFQMNDARCWLKNRGFICEWMVFW